MCEVLQSKLKALCIFVILVLGSTAFIATSAPNTYGYTVHVYERKLKPIKIVLNEQKPKRTLLFQFAKSWRPGAFERNSILVDSSFRHYYRIRAKDNKSESSDDVPRFALHIGQANDNQGDKFCSGKAQQSSCNIPKIKEFDLPLGEGWTTHSNVSDETAHTHQVTFDGTPPQSFKDTSKLYIELEWLQGPPITIELHYAAQALHTYSNRDEDTSWALPDFDGLDMRVTMTHLDLR